jgi:hypothetical protein
MTTGAIKQEGDMRRISSQVKRMAVVDALGVSYPTLFLVVLVTVDTEDKQSNGR